MKLRTMAVFVAALAAACSQKPPTISGAYINHDPNSAAMLQLTESPDGKVLGSMSLVSIQAGGALDRKMVNVTGTTDGSSLTLVLKFQQINKELNVSGVMDHGIMVLSLPAVQGGQDIRLVPAKMEDFQVAMDEVSKNAGAAHQSAQKAAVTATIDKMVETDTAALILYNQRAKAPSNIADIDKHFEGLLQFARQDLATEKGWLAKLNTSPVADGQAGVAQAQLGVAATQFGLYRDEVLTSVANSRAHIAQLDQMIANSACTNKVPTPPDMGVCRIQDQAISEYKVAKAHVLDMMAEREQLAHKRDSDMQALVQAGHSH